jgi:hypothetical protein
MCCRFLMRVALCGAVCRSGPTVVHQLTPLENGAAGLGSAEVSARGRLEVEWHIVCCGLQRLGMIGSAKQQGLRQEGILLPQPSMVGFLGKACALTRGTCPQINYYPARILCGAVSSTATGLPLSALLSWLHVVFLRFAILSLSSGA